MEDPPGEAAGDDGGLDEVVMNRVEGFLGVHEQGVEAVPFLALRRSVKLAEQVLDVVEALSALDGAFLVRMDATLSLGEARGDGFHNSFGDDPVVAVCDTNGPRVLRQQGGFLGEEEEQALVELSARQPTFAEVDQHAVNDRSGCSGDCPVGSEGDAVRSGAGVVGVSDAVSDVLDRRDCGEQGLLELPGGS